MKKYIYLSLFPEALIASHLSPEEFGAYYATGVFRRSCGQALFFEVDPNFKSDYLPMDKIDELCQPHADGSPHKSVYLSVYRVLEHVPLASLKNLYVVTSDGKTLEIKPSAFTPDDSKLFLYQNLAPVRPRVASVLNPAEYVKRLTSEDRLVHTDKIAFCDLLLGDLEKDPENGELGDLPYKNVAHLRDCLKQVQVKGKRNNKIVVRTLMAEILYRTIKSGFYVGDKDAILYYPMPSKEELENKHYNWWRSALASFGE